jgi:hypothetical protein
LSLDTIFGRDLAPQVVAVIQIAGLCVFRGLQDLTQIDDAEFVDGTEVCSEIVREYPESHAVTTSGCRVAGPTRTEIGRAEMSPVMKQLFDNACSSRRTEIMQRRDLKPRRSLETAEIMASLRWAVLD